MLMFYNNQLYLLIIIWALEMFGLFVLNFGWFICFCDADDQGKVFGGRLARKGEFPSAVGIVEKIVCGGTLVTLDKVLTAAHCMVDAVSRVPKPTDGYTVYAGTTLIPLPPNFKKSEETQKRKISSAKLHDGFKRKTDKSSYHDIALIILRAPFEKAETVATAQFPTTDEKKFLEAWKALVSSGKKCVGVGWGSTVYVEKEGKVIPDVVSEDLKAVDLTPLDQKSCKALVRKEDEDMTEKGEVCVSSKVEGDSVCKGDSGSPLFCDGYIFALARAVIGCGPKSEAQFYLLYGPYFDYFSLGVGCLLPNHIIISFMIIFHNYASPF